LITQYVLGLENASAVHQTIQSQLIYELALSLDQLSIGLDVESARVTKYLTVLSLQDVAALQAKYTHLAYCGLALTSGHSYHTIHFQPDFFITTCGFFSQLQSGNSGLMNGQLGPEGLHTNV